MSASTDRHCRPSPARVRIKRAAAALGILAGLRQGRDRLRAAAAWRRNAPLRRAGAPDGLPLPPTHMILAVTGTTDIAWFLDSGARAAAGLQAALIRCGASLDRARRVLDFGCGCGRVLRHFKDLPAELHGADFNPRLIRWCRRHLRFARCVHNLLSPPLPYPDGRFDLVYALSVFTHLPETLQRPWVAELHRVLETGGHLILSVHGRGCLLDLTAAQRERFEAGAPVFKSDLPGTNASGAYHPEAYLRQLIAPYFVPIAFQPLGASGNPSQDLYTLRKL